MNLGKLTALVWMELKKLFRAPAYLFVMVLFPGMLAIMFRLAFGTSSDPTGESSMFDAMVPGLFAYACIFITLTVAQTFVDDREQGLLKRISTTPTTSSEFMGSHIISNTILSIIQVIVVIISSFLMGFRSEGGAIGLIFAFIFMILLSICSVGLGLITATISKSAGAATGIAFIFIMPQMFLGTFVPSNELTEIIAKFLPSYYVTDAITMIFNGAALTEKQIWTDLMFIAIMSVVIIIVGVQVFKKYGNR